MSQYIHVRGARSDDANAIIDIDIKCFESAWSPEEWVKMGKSMGVAISVVTNYGSPVGFGVFRHDRETQSVEIVKLAIKEIHRRQGISKRLLEAGTDFAVARLASYLGIIVPEETIYPGPLNVSTWLKAVGFDAREFIKDHFESYGTCQDGVKFTRPITRL